MYISTALLPILSDAALTGAAAAAMFAPRRRQPVVIFLVTVAFAIYGYYSFRYPGHHRPKTIVEPPPSAVILSAARALSLRSRWSRCGPWDGVGSPWSRYCSALRRGDGAERAGHAGMALDQSRVSGSTATISGGGFRLVNLESLSIAVLLGLGIGVLCGRPRPEFYRFTRRRSRGDDLLGDGGRPWRDDLRPRRAIDLSLRPLGHSRKQLVRGLEPQRRRL